MVAARADTGAGHDAPTAAVPMLLQGLVSAVTGVAIVTHGPHIVGRHRRHSIEIVAMRAGAGAGHDAPTAAVPMLHQRLVTAAAAFAIVTHGPHIVGRYRRHPTEVVICPA